MIPSTLIFGILTFLLVLGPLIILHELGHFFTAKLTRTKVVEFGFGFPPRATGWWTGRTQVFITEETIFQGLEIPYRVIEIAAGELGAPAYRKFDLEAWMPGRESWGEITSTSNCTDFQARRLKIRFRRDGSKKTELVHMLNGTAISNARTILAILENHQQSEGTIKVPEKLVPYLGQQLID